MELKEYLKIFRENIGIFIFVIVIIIAGSFVYFALKPISYTSSLVLNITRDGIQQTTDYRYDDFYRLQADDKFSETVVEWLKSPRTAVDVYAKAEADYNNLSLRQLGKIFSPEKRSSQIVLVSFSAGSEKSAREISNALVAVVSQNTEMLNEKQNEGTWFRIAAQDPVIVQDQTKASVIFLVSLAIGVFLGFWLVMIKHYLR